MDATSVRLTPTPLTSPTAPRLPERLIMFPFDTPVTLTDIYGPCPWDADICADICDHDAEPTTEEITAYLRSKLTGEPMQTIGEGTAVFTRTDGLTVTVENAIVDSIGPVGDSPFVISVETSDDREIVHVPFVASWVITY